MIFVHLLLIVVIVSLIICITKTVPKMYIVFVLRSSEQLQSAPGGCRGTAAAPAARRVAQRSAPRLNRDFLFSRTVNLCIYFVLLLPLRQLVTVISIEINKRN